MRIKLNLSRADGSHADLHLTVDADCTVGDLADRLAASDPAGAKGAGSTLIRADQSGTVTLERNVPVIESGLQSGASIALAEPLSAMGHGSTAAAVLTVHRGPDAGRTFELRSGANTVGRGRQCAVQLSDPMVSTLHARIVVGDAVEIIDENSSNGILMGGQQVSRVSLTADDRVVLGENVVSVRLQHGSGDRPGAGRATVEFNRSPRVDPVYEGPELVAPDPPGAPQPQRFPMIAALMPLLMGVVLLVALRRWEVVIFVALSPLMMVGNWWEHRRASRRAHEEEVRVYRANLADLLARGRSAQDEERQRRAVEHPGTADAVQAIMSRDSLLWTRRPEHDGFMELRLGLGEQRSRVTINVNPSRSSIPELVHELEQVTSQFTTVDRVPVVASFETCGSVGISGPTDAMLAVARGVVLQLVGLHAPSEVVVCGVASVRTAGRWEWLKWMPHTSSDHSPLSGPHLASTPPGCSNLVAELSDVVAAREAAAEGSRDSAPLPRVVVLVEDDAPVDRNRLVRLAETGPAVGVHLLWVATSTAQLPAACRTFLEVDATDGSASTGRVVEAELTRPVLVEPVNDSDAERLARALSPVVDAGALADDQSDLPSSVSFLSDAGPELADSPEAVLDRWRESHSLFPPSEFPDGRARPTSRRKFTLRALVGRGKGDNTYLDLREHGPHALVGGTTGSGKSEFLQTWVMGMATAHGPQRVTFLFVDYKGGSAFADCVDLPHCVGLVTDLSPHLVRRALTSLRAELRHREHLLNRHAAKDLLELESTGNPEAPPSLVIVVDEFAALVQEVPEFVDGVVDVAQRGRSLGLHLILATQRPAGVIKDNLRANTNLRVALRVADDDDSRDVIGTPVAATFDPSLPGRAAAKTGPGRLTSFQAGYLGGWTRREAPAPTIVVETLEFAAPQEWELPESAGAHEALETGPNDIQRLAKRVLEAARAADIPAPRRPWLPELDPIYDLERLQLPRRDTALAFGVIDDPEAQSQHIVSFHPDEDGNMAVYGTGGTGKSTFLRTLAVSAGLTFRGGPCAVYGLDFGARGLQMIEALPHVGSVIAADDHERIARLLRQLRDTIDERAARYAALQAGSIGEYRVAANEPNEPRVLLLVDGMGAFRSAYETGEHSRLFELFQAIAVDGRQVGVHVVISADRTGAVPMSLASSIQRNLVLRLSSDMDLVALGAPSDGFSRTSPPGRGFLEDQEVQVAVLGGTRNVAAQAARVQALARRLRKEEVVEAPPVERLSEHISLASLPGSVDATGAPVTSGDGLVVFGVADETLGPVGFDPTTSLLIAGPARSGRSTAVATAVEAIRRAVADSRFVLLGQRRSPLPGRGGWFRQAAGVDEVAELAEKLATEIEDDPAAAHGLVLVIEGIGEFLNSTADYPLVELLKAARAADVGVIAEGETPTLSGSWPLLAPLKGGRQGIVLQPDQMDGDSLFHTSFPRLARAEFPVGRGMYVRAGRAARVQVAVP